MPLASPGLENRLVMFRTLGRLKMLQWRPRLVALALVAASIAIALGGGIEELLNLYW
jgi:hypothetical protein